MHRLVLLAALLAPAAAFADARDWTPTAFDRVESAGAYDVTIVPGPRAAVHAEGDRDEISRIRVRVDGGKLSIGHEREFSFGITYHHRIHVTVTTPAPLKGAELSGSGTVTVARVDAPSFKAEISGSGDMRLNQVNTRALSASVSGSGSITAVGRADKVSGDVAGSGDLRFADLHTADLSADIAGSGDVNAFATRSATISVMGSGNARVRGGARCTVSKAGSGHVDCGA